jgi:hypothetical protein
MATRQRSNNKKSGSKPKRSGSKTASKPRSGSKTASKPRAPAEKAGMMTPTYTKVAIGIMILAIIGLIIGLVIFFTSSNSTVVVMWEEACVPLITTTVDWNALTTTPQSYLDFLDNLPSSTVFVQRPTKANESTDVFVKLAGNDLATEKQLKAAYDAFRSGLPSNDQDKLVLMGVRTELNSVAVQGYAFGLAAAPSSASYASLQSSQRLAIVFPKSWGYASSPKFCTPSGGGGTGAAGSSAPPYVVPWLPLPTT